LIKIWRECKNTEKNAYLRIEQNDNIDFTDLM